MFEDLVELDAAGFMPESGVQADALLNAKYSTASLLEELGVKPDYEIQGSAEREAAREAFGILATTNNPEVARLAVASLQAPEAVKHLIAMLTPYDWQFVEQATEIRGYTVAKLIEETKGPNASHRLRALELLGKITEVALFTERMEVKRIDMTDDELERKIREKLGRVIDITPEASA